MIWDEMRSGKGYDMMQGMIWYDTSYKRLDVIRDMRQALIWSKHDMIWEFRYKKKELIMYEIQYDVIRDTILDQLWEMRYEMRNNMIWDMIWYEIMIWELRYDKRENIW